MANQNTAAGGDFTSNLGRVYALYTGGFLGFVLFLAVLEQVGVPNNILGYLFVIFTIGVYALIGIMSRTMQVSEYYVAGRKVPAFYNGMATGGGLDVGGLLHRHGRHALRARL
jgi:cation/acetate symporter